MTPLDQAISEFVLAIDRFNAVINNEETDFPADDRLSVFARILGKLAGMMEGSR